MSDIGSAISACADLLNESAAADNFSGVALIARDGVPLFQRAYGYASRGLSVRNHTDTRFNIGSMSKMFTAVSIAQLAEQGRIDFHDSISSILPDYPGDIGTRVSIHHLLTHTSGMGSFWNAAFDAARTTVRTVSDHLPLFQDDPLAFEPGERFRYSNAGFLVLGAIIERATGVSYDEYVRQNIYDRAGMFESGAWGLDEDVPNRAIGYTRHEDEGDQKPWTRTNVLVVSVKGSPAGGSYSTVHDLLRFVEALRSHTLLSEEYTRALLEPRVSMGPQGHASYAYGFGCHLVGGTRIVGHNGGAPGVGAQLDIYLDADHAAIVLSNYDASVSLKVVQPMRLLLTGASA